MVLPLIHFIIKNLNGSINTISTSISKDSNVAVSTDKAQKQHIFVFKFQYIHCLINELSTDDSLGNTTKIYQYNNKE